MNGNGPLASPNLGDSMTGGAKLSKTGKLQPLQTRVSRLRWEEAISVTAIRFVIQSRGLITCTHGSIPLQKSGHAVRLVPNGQVYKQIFDAEVQLVKSLKKCEEARIQRENTKILDEANANKTNGDYSR